MERHLAAQRRERGTKHYQNIIMDHNRLYFLDRLYSSFSEGDICYIAELRPPLHTFRQTAMTRAVGLPLLSVKTSDALFVHKFPWSEWIGEIREAWPIQHGCPRLPEGIVMAIATKKNVFDLWLLYLWSPRSACVEQKKPYSYKQGFPEFSQKSL